MKVRVRDNLWTNLDWWDQLVAHKNQVIVRNLDINHKVTAQLVLVEDEDQEKLKALVDFLHTSALNNDKSFNVENWMNRTQEKKKSNKRTKN